eukprot:1154293-Pelagomonas_calceolata.AAC.2
MKAEQPNFLLPSCRPTVSNPIVHLEGTRLASKVTTGLIPAAVRKRTFFQYCTLYNQKHTIRFKRSTSLVYSLP